MKIEFDEHKFNPIVTLSENEIKSAFESEEQFQLLLHEITRKCYGEFVANICFPLKGGNE